MEQRLFSIGGAASRLGVSPSAIRRWEEVGIVPPAQRCDGNGRRVYTVQDLDDIRARMETKRAAGRQQGNPERAA